VDEMTMVGHLLAEPPPPSVSVTDRAWQRLDARMSGQVLPLRRRRIGPVLVAVAAAGAAAAITITALVPAGSHPAGPGSALTGQPARGFLLAMSAKAAHSQASGRFWCQNEIQGTRGLIGAGDKEIAPAWFNGKPAPASAPPGYKYAIFGRSAEVNCLELPHGAWQGGTAAFSYQSLGVRPASPADMAAWRRDGSPDHWKAWVGGTVSTRPGKVIWGGPKSGDKSDGWGVSLPSNPAKLRKLLLKDISLPQGQSVNILGYTLGGGGSHPDSQLFSVATELMNSPVSPAVRAALYHVLAGIRDAQMRPGVTDPEGQTGTAVWFGKPGQLPGDYQLIDPATGRLIAEMGVSTRPVYGAPAGTVLYYSAWTSSGWTNHLPVPASQLTPALRQVEHQH
jgi:hypothetical protein